MDRTNTYPFGRFQAVNDPDKPLLSLSEGERERVLVELAERLIELMGGDGVTV